MTQVKEKEGELRFYLEYTRGMERSREIEEAYRKVQERSLRVCEECGLSGVIRYNRVWLKVLCDQCERKEREEQRKSG